MVSKQRYYAPSDWNFSNNCLEGTEWSVTGSSDNMYTVRITNRGFVCTCQGFGFHGKCKHAKTVVEKFDE